MEKDEDGERKERETLDRVLASNDKIQMDNLVAHCRTLMNYSELAMKQAIEFQQKSNDIHLQQMDAREKQRLEHENELETQRQENNRYTLDRLYSVFPEEAAGLVPLLQGVLDVLRGQAKVKKEDDEEEEAGLKNE